MQVQTIFCNQIQYCVFRTSVRARILKFLSKPSPTPIYYPQVFASALSRNSSGTAIAFLRACRAHPLARWFAGRSSTCHTRPCRPCIPLSCNSSDKAIAIPRASRAHPLARWHQFVSIERREPLQTSLQGTSARAMVCRKITDLPPTGNTQPSEPG